MLDSAGFDLWADGYDRSVGLSEEENSYPFAGYKAVLNHIYRRVMSKPGAAVLDLGFGTGNLTRRLWEGGCQVYGMDFSPRMIELAREKMPGAHLCQGDFALGLPPELAGRRYDFIVATYSLHHLTDAGKVELLQDLLALLNSGGELLIGDVAFGRRDELEACRTAAGEEWDEEEIYFVCEELRPQFPGLTFTPCSHCAGVLTLQKPRLSLHVPSLEELWYRADFMSDPATMDYNRGYTPYPGYHRDTGCIDFPPSEWADWYDRWIGNEPERFYAYVEREDGAWVGEANFHRSPTNPWHEMGVIIEAKHRGQAYGLEALHLLIYQAFAVCGIDALHNDFETTREAALQMHLAAGFREYRRSGDLVELMLTREDYLHSR